MIPWCGIIKFLIGLAVNAFIAAAGVYICTSCIYTNGTFGTCPKNICVGHLIIWIVICTVPTFMSAFQVGVAFMYWITFHLSKGRVTSLSDCCKKSCVLCRTRTDTKAYEKQYCHDEEEEALNDEEAVEMFVDEYGKEFKLKRHKRKDKIPAPQNMIVKKMPKSTLNKTSFILFGFISILCYTIWFFCSPICDWYIYLLPGFIYLKILNWSVSACVASYRYSQKHKEVFKIVQEAIEAKKDEWVPAR